MNEHNSTNLVVAAPNLLKACETGARHTDEEGPELLRRAADVLASHGYNDLAVDLHLKAGEEQRAINKAREGSVIDKAIKADDNYYTNWRKQ